VTQTGGKSDKRPDGTVQLPFDSGMFSSGKFAPGSAASVGVTRIGATSQSAGTGFTTTTSVGVTDDESAAVEYDNVVASPTARRATGNSQRSGLRVDDDALFFMAGISAGLTANVSQQQFSGWSAVFYRRS
jgi:hypothetical protein